MKKTALLSLFLLLSLSFLCYCFQHRHPLESTSTPVPVTISSDSIPPTQPSPSLSLHAKGACVIDASSSRILYGKNEKEPRPMASTTKIMTCLLALEQGNLADTVTFSPNATRMPKVHLGVKAGACFHLKDLLYSLMLESHNDSAVAIAEHLGQSVEHFAELMNAKAKELHLNQTHFVTPNGLDSPEHVSTPYDMCRLASYALQNPDFIKIIQTSHISIQEIHTHQTYSLTNRDLFLTTYSGALGIKTGFTGNAGYCFVGAAKRNGQTLTSCVLASGWPPDKSWKWADTKSLMDYGFENYHTISLPIKNINGIQIPVLHGINSSISVTTSCQEQALVSSFDSIDICYDLPATLTAPIKANEIIGFIRIFINQQEVRQIPIRSEEENPRITPRDYIKCLLSALFSF